MTKNHNENRSLYRSSEPNRSIFFGREGQIDVKTNAKKNQQATYQYRTLLHPEHFLLPGFPQVAQAPAAGAAPSPPASPLPIDIERRGSYPEEPASKLASTTKYLDAARFTTRSAPERVNSRANANCSTAERSSAGRAAPSIYDLGFPQWSEALHGSSTSDGPQATDRIPNYSRTPTPSFKSIIGIGNLRTWWDRKALAIEPWQGFPYGVSRFPSPSKVSFASRAPERRRDERKGWVGIYNYH